MQEDHSLSTLFLMHPKSQKGKADMVNLDKVRKTCSQGKTKKIVEQSVIEDFKVSHKVEATN